VQEKAKFKVYKREPEEIVYRENSTKLSSRKNRTRKNYPQKGPEKLFLRSTRRNQEPDKIKRVPDEIFFREEPDEILREPDEILFKEVPNNYLQGGLEELCSWRFRQIIFKEVPKNYVQGGLEELSSRKNYPQGGAEELSLRRYRRIVLK
jgi:hypothetical protein